MAKPDREIMEIVEAFDLTGCAHSAVPAGCDEKSVTRYVAIRGAGRNRWRGGAPERRRLVPGETRGALRALVEDGDASMGPRPDGRGNSALQTPSTTRDLEGDGE